MNDADKTTAQLIQELAEMRQQAAEGEASLTERKRAEAALAAEKGRLAVTLSSIGDGVIATDLEANIVLINGVAEELTGWQEEEALGRPLADIFHIISEGTRERCENPVERVLASGRVVGLANHTVLVSKDGTERVVADSAAPILDAEGNIIGVVLVFRDDTARRQAEERISRQSRLLAGINRVFQEALTCETVEELGKTCLAVAEDLTGSKFGFLGQINEAGSFDALAISNPGWAACEIAVSDARRSVASMPIRGIDRSTMRDGQSRIVNEDEMPTHPDRVGVPEGHPAITAFLGVPLKQRGKTVGMIALANKEGGYEAADQKAIEALSFSFVEALERKRAELELHQHREHLDRLVRERTKELRCLFEIGKIVEEPGISPENIYRRTAEIIPPAWQYPEITCARVIMEGGEFRTDNFQETEWRQSATVRVHGQEAGIVEVCYLEERPGAHEGPFLAEERHLIEAIAERLGRIVERIRSEEALRTSERRYRTLIENLPQKVFLKDASSVYVSGNGRFARELGIALDELGGKTDFDFFPRELAEKYRADDRRIMAAGQVEEIEEAYLYQGEERFVHTVKTPIQDEHGNTSGILGIFWDVTERKREQDAARQAEDRFRATFEQAAVGIAHVGLDGRWLCVNQKLCDIVGYTREELLEKTFQDITHPDDLDIDVAYVRQVLAGERQTYSMEKRYFRKDGSTVWVNLTVAVVRKSSGEPDYFISVVEYIADRKQAEDALRELKQELEERVERRTAELRAANDELEAFAYSVSHDLRAPIRAIDGFSKVLFEDHAVQLDDEGKRVLGVVLDSTRNMGDLIDDLLAFSRLSRREMRRSLIDMARLTQEVFEQLQQALPRRELLLNIGPLPPVHGDRGLVREVLGNLLGNAIKFTALRAKAIIDVAGMIEGTEVIYSVRDNGAGFNMNYADKLFQVFQRLHSVEEFEGTGIGLALVQRIIHRHAGRVWAEGKVGEGAVFYFSLPLPETDDAESRRS